MTDIAKKVAAYTLGCKVNYYETEAILSLFHENGYEIADFDDCADVYIINTCSVTNASDKKSRQAVRRARMKNPDAVVAAVGCHTQYAAGETDVDGADILIGNKDKYKILSVVENYDKGAGIYRDISDISAERRFDSAPLSGAPRFSDRQRVFIKIEDGCDNFCAYCVIPHLRGQARSRDKDDILREVEKTALAGYKEIVLTGICLSSYGNDLNGAGLTEILNGVNKIGGIKRIRLSSVEPTLISDGFVDELKKIDKLCPHFHLPLQSGCDETLARMGRKYTAGQYAENVGKIRAAFPRASVTTDIITGFPGETEREFEKSAEFARGMGFMKIHVFPYSAKKGTRAYEMPDRPPKSAANGRAAVLRRISDESARRFYTENVGREAEILVEKQTGKGRVFGHTESYIPASADAEAEAGDIISVVMSGCDNEFMYARKM